MSLPRKNTVLIHGFGFDHRIWSPVEIAFEGHQVTYLSLPGFGNEKIDAPYTIQSLATRYWQEINDRIQEPVHLVGHSMGGYVCIEMAAQKPEMVASLALIHSHVFADAPEKKEARNATIADIEKNGKEGFIKKFIPPLFGSENDFAEIKRILIERGLSYDTSAWTFGTQAIRDRTDHTETFKSLHIPVLSVMGENDKAVPVELAYKQAALAEQMSLHVYPGVGHLAMYEACPTLIRDLVRFYDLIA